MGRKYRNPPVVEAVCEFRLTQDTPWDLTIPGLFYEQVKDEFPHREQRVVQEIEIKPSSQGLQQLRVDELTLLFTDDRKMLVQIGSRILSVNVLKPYPTWEKFKHMIEKVLSALNQTTEIKGFQRVGLRYINRIEIPSLTISLEDYFQFYPFVGQQLPQSFSQFIVGCVFTYFEKRDQCKVQLTSAPSSSQKLNAYILDIDYFLARERGVNMREIDSWIENAHEKVEEIFEGSIKDSLRELFQEVK